MDGNIEKMQSLTGRIKGLGIDKTLTKKGMCAEAEATGKALAKKVNTADIVDDLTSVAEDKPLSANQGRLLKKQIDEIDPHNAENVVYGDTNVKNAIDKLSKAENISYNEEKSVQGAIDELNTNVEDVQTQIDTINKEKHLVIKTATRTGTTDANGNLIITNLTYEAHILNIQCTSSPEGAYCFVIGRANNYWLVRVLSNHSDYLAVANKNMTVEIEYLVYE